MPGQSRPVESTPAHRFGKQTYAACLRRACEVQAWSACSESPASIVIGCWRANLVASLV